MSIKGLDVSAYQGEIDWQQVASAGYQFAILRGVTKNGEIDSTFFFNYKNATAAGLEVSCYQYSYALSELEACNAAKNMISKLRGIKMPIWIDLEWDRQGELGKQVVTQIAKAYVYTCRSLGYECHIYSNLDWYKNRYYSDELKAMGCKFWIARYANSGQYVESLKPEIGEYIWQYTSSGVIPGISGKVDLNIKYEETVNAIGTYSLKKDGEMCISPNFKVKEFKCKDGSDIILIDTNFVKEKLQPIRDKFGVPVTINSAYRTADYNKRVGGAAKSYHLTGQAFDIAVKGKTPAAVARYAQQLGIKGIIRYDTFVHVDSRDKQYLAVVSGGKTKTVSSF